jgi:hypothetical protein
LGEVGSRQHRKDEADIAAAARPVLVRHTRQQAELIPQVAAAHRGGGAAAARRERVVDGAEGQVPRLPAPIALVVVLLLLLL